MRTRLRWVVEVMLKQAWVRAAAYSLMAVATALAAIVVGPHLPDHLSADVGADSVESILTILASSMLAVTTFSLGAIVTAYSAAGNSATPRASQLVVEDRSTQSILSTFIGTFIFALVGIIGLAMELYSEGGRAVLFLSTLGVVVFVVISLLRWVTMLTSLGRLSDSLRRVEEAASCSFESWWQAPNLGGRPLPDGWDGAAAGMKPLYATTGYIQHIDAKSLITYADTLDLTIVLTGTPGAFVSQSRPALWISREVDEPDQQRLIRCIAVADVRTFDQDPRFGAEVMTEVATRALSPSANDPGTAIEVISRLHRLLEQWHTLATSSWGPEASDRLMAPSIEVSELFDDAFRPIAREGAGEVEVGIRLQKTLIALAQLSPEFETEARRVSAEAFTRAEAALPPMDLKALAQVAAPLL